MITLKTSKSKRSAKTHKVKPLKAASKIAKLKYFGTNARFKPESLPERPGRNFGSIFLKGLFTSLLSIYILFFTCKYQSAYRLWRETERPRGLINTELYEQIFSELLALLISITSACNWMNCRLAVYYSHGKYLLLEIWNPDEALVCAMFINKKRVVFKN